MDVVPDTDTKGWLGQVHAMFLGLIAAKGKPLHKTLETPSPRRHFVGLSVFRRGSQVVRPGSAKAPCVGSIPTRASSLNKKGVPIQDALLLN